MQAVLGHQVDFASEQLLQVRLEREERQSLGSLRPPDVHEVDIAGRGGVASCRRAEDREFRQPVPRGQRRQGRPQPQQFLQGHVTNCARIVPYLSHSRTARSHQDPVAGVTRSRSRIPAGAGPGCLRPTYAGESCPHSAPHQAKRPTPNLWESASDLPLLGSGGRI